MGSPTYRRSYGVAILIVVVSFLFGYQMAVAAPRAIASPVVPAWFKSTLQFLRFDTNTESIQITQENMQILYEVLDRIGAEYINADIDPQKIIYGAASGAVSSLGDPYSRFVPPAPAVDMKNDIAGVYSGVGISIEDRHGHTVIINVFPESPAEISGIRSGDIISSVDGEDILGQGSLRAAQVIRGEEGTDVEIGVLRAGEDEELKFTCKRANVKYPSVWESRMLEGDIGYIEITQFNKETANDLRIALADLQSQGMKGLVLDLRNNAGGPLDAAVYVSDIFLSEGPVVYLKGRDGTLIPDPVEPNGKDGAQAVDLPLVVLINQYSASASEIVAGAIQDYGVGTIMGQTSFGKGVVQNVIPMTDGSYLVLTTNKYLTPDERDINEVGIEPDVPISLETEDIEDEYVSGMIGEMEALSEELKAMNDELREYLREHDYQLDIASDYLESEITGG